MKFKSDEADRGYSVVSVYLNMIVLFFITQHAPFIALVNNDLVAFWIKLAYVLPFVYKDKRSNGSKILKMMI